MAKPRLNRLNRPKKPIDATLKQWAKKLPYLMLILAVVVSAFGLHRSELFQPKISWTIDTNLSNDAAYYEQLIDGLLDNKYLINLSDLKKNMESEPWVANAEVGRIFWNKINITLSAHIIAMNWQDAGYISTNGVLFKPVSLVDSKAPMAIVDEENVSKFFKNYLQYQAIVEPLLITRFERGQIDKLTIEPNVDIVLGHQKQEQRLKDFVKAYNKLQKTSRKIRKRGVFDMRYAKGFALSYQPQ